jgi:hypothetical protein
MQKREAKVTVNRTYKEVIKRKQTEVYQDEAETVEVYTFEDIPTATVSVRAGITKNLGDFNSASIQVSVTLPTFVEQIDDAAAYANQKVEEYIAPALDEFVDVLKEKKLIK